MYKFKFADIGEGLHEGVVGEIFKKVGDDVQEGDPLFSVETDKMASDIPSPVTGKVTKVLIESGKTVHVGDDTFYFEVEGGSADTSEEVKEEAPSDDDNASVVGEVKVSNDLLNTDFKSNNKVLTGEVRSGKVATTIKNQDGVLTTPLARSLAAEKGIDISQVLGSGHNGRVLVKDVEGFKGASQSGGAAVRQFTPGGETRVPVSPVRKAIAKAMVNSWSNVAYTNLVLEVNITSIFEQRKQITQKHIIEKLGTKVTFLPFIVKAAAIALSHFPMLNAKYDEKSNEIIQYHDKNIGIAVDTPHGLFVPVVKNAEQKTIVEISKEIGELAVKAKNRKLSMAEMSGGTFSVSNYGSAGAMFGVPIINFPEMGILGTGTIFDKVLPAGNGFKTAKMMHLTGSADHRWVDGADVGRFLSKIKQILENPILLLGEFNV